MMKYKLCILAAGSGKRMHPLTKSINKALLPVDSKAAISHVIEKHSPNIEIIIAVNYEKEKIKQVANYLGFNSIYPLMPEYIEKTKKFSVLVLNYYMGIMSLKN